MAFIVTADIQAEFSTLDLCTKAWNEIISICTDRKLRTIVVAGDLKQAMNPVDVRVIKWWQHAIGKAIRHGIEVVCVLGNHDRVGAYTSADNWFSILKKAGAKTYDEPAVHQLQDMRLFILPFDSVSNTKRNAKKLLKYKPDRKRDVLIFHANLLEARYNRQGSKSSGTLTTSDLHSRSYRYCVGGDVHFPQRIQQNTYYVGSPFCQDWGEVNQVKRYLICREDKIISVLSRLPRWFDPSIDGFRRTKPTAWEGARIRISVDCDASEDYGQRLEKARKKAERKYKGAYIYVVPKFTEKSVDEVAIKTTDSDEYKINKYYEETIPRKLSRSDTVKYMLKVLAQSTAGMRQQLDIEFEYTKARNFLSYEKLFVDFRKRGIVLIQGVNEDRGGKSNGSGKTSLVQPIPVGMFGKTFKGQKADAWRNRWTEGNAYVEVVCRADKRRIKIRRERTPTALRMEVNGRQVSSGMRSTDREGTQGQIEQLLGFTWHTLANAVYIDRSIADAFVSGTNSVRTSILSRFQNLERFDTALKYVKKQTTKLDKKIAKVTLLLERTRSTITQLTKSIEDVRLVQDSHVKEFYSKIKKVKKESDSWHHAHKSVFQKLYSKETKYETLSMELLKKSNDAKSQVIIAQREFDTFTEISGKWFRVAKKRKCPTCFQQVSKQWAKGHSKDVQREFDAKRKAWDDAQAIYASYNKKAALLEGKFDGIQIKLSRLDRKSKDFDYAIQHWKKQYKQLSHSKGEAQWVIERSKRKLEELKDGKLVLKNKLQSYKHKMRILRYAQEAFSRDGIPAFLNRQLCPVLNRASEYYAELFSDKEIQVRFRVEGGEFTPEIINTRGGEGIEDQSTGERALAGLIASFALREVAPKCNLLILDEPGEGLDAQTARQFARSLQTLKKRFGTIFVATHNQNILSELSHERTITVRKKNKISRVEEEK